MKKIIALALVLVMALSMASVAFAKVDADLSELATYETAICPGDKVVVSNTWTAEKKAAVKVVYDFTSASADYKGASLIESIEWVKNADLSKEAKQPIYDLVLTVKENLTATTEKDFAGEIVILEKKTDRVVGGKIFDTTVGNNVEYISGDKKADQATPIDEVMDKNTVMYAEDGAGYVSFEAGLSLAGVVKVENNEKAQVYAPEKVDADLMEAVEEYLGEDYDAIVEYYYWEGTGFKNDVTFAYDAYAEDPHFFYAWDGEKFVDLEAKYDDDEEVDAYVFTANAKGLIIVTDTEIVAAAEETKNPDTGANDVVGVAAALAVVSLVAAGAVSLKK